MKSHIGLIIALVLLSGLVGCNLPDASSAIPMVSVGMATDCRTGPGPFYDPVTVLNPGQASEAIGRNPEGDYWLIRDPADPTNLCWLDGKYVVVTGDPHSLPTFAPPPIPTSVGGPTLIGGCPTPVGGGPTPVSCAEPIGGCPTPIGGGPTPISCAEPIGGCPTPIDGGPTPISCGEPMGGCPTPIGGGPTPVSCGEPIGGCPTPIGGGPTPVSCPTQISKPTPVPTKVYGPTPVPTKVVRPTKVPTPTPVK